MGYEQRKKKTKDELNYFPKYVVDIIRDFLENGKIYETQSKCGDEKKINDEVLKCLICTILDFPEASDDERAKYIHKYETCQKDLITDRTINPVLNEYNVKLKNPCFSAVQRNTFSGILRYLWARKIKDISLIQIHF